MGFDVSRPRAYRRMLLAIGAAVVSVFAGCFALGAPAFAASSADLSGTLTNKPAVAGQRVSYVVVVTNHGPSTAQKVQIDFFTSSALASVRYSNPSGRCIRSPKETACLFGPLRVGQSAHATISGIVSKSLKKGTPIDNRVVLGSDTHLVNTSNDVVTDNYLLGVPKTVAPAPSPSPTVGTKIDSITHVATSTIAASHTALILSLVALGAAAVWFAAGLSWKAYKRRHSSTQEYD